jgi:rare lipoprotein A
MTHLIRLARLLPLAALALAAACATPRGGYYQDDGPHARPPVDVSKVPDAVPRDEPVNERNNRPYAVFGVSYRPLKSAYGYRERGVASWYGKKFHGRKTSNGETYDMYAMTAAHKTLPLPSYARVRNLNNGQSVIVRVNDRGPFRDNRLIDLSYAAAHRLGILGSGTGVVEVEGLSGDQPVTTVAARERPAANLIATAEAAPAPRLYLQAGAFASRENAENLRNRLAQADLRPVHVAPAQVDGVPLYRVRLGPLDSVDASDRLAERVQAQGLPKPIIVVD